ncbi:MAG: hypothetical protein C1943_01655 [Halochromatium sp.]|nr:hypothetical protein [Halochromatium sp.]
MVIGSNAHRPLGWSIRRSLARLCFLMIALLGSKSINAEEMPLVTDLFGPQQIIVASEVNGARSVYGSDLDGDGDLDVLSASSDDGKIAWYENLGGGAFGPQQVITTEAIGATVVYAIDLDADRDVDVLSASSSGNKFAWYENLGNGSFGSQQIISSAAATDYFQAIDAADLDGDGDIDILSSSCNDGKIAWYSNSGHGSFGSQRLIALLSCPRFAYARDLDGDGYADVLSASGNDNRMFWYRNLGDGSFGPQQVIATTAAYPPVFAHITDIEGDGDFDIISAYPSDNKIVWHENLGDGSFALEQVVTTATTNLRTLSAADLDGDGDADVILVSGLHGSEQVVWYENLGAGTFGSQSIITATIKGAVSLYTADFDADGDTDVLSVSVFDQKIAWYENDGSGKFGEQQVLTGPSVNEPISVYAIDLDGDADADVLSASSRDDKVAWYENLGGDVFGPQQVITDQAVYVKSVYAIDLDGDGDADVLSAEYGQISWYENLGGTFGAQRAITTDVGGGTSPSVFATDLDGDGDADVLAAAEIVYENAWTGSITWYENLGDGRFGPQEIVTTAVRGSPSIYAIDLDGDGDADVLSASYLDDQIAWYENLGGGYFEPQEIITTAVDGPTNSVYAIDLDEDGDADVLSASGEDGKIAWYENLGATFGPQQVIGMEAMSGASSVYATDLDGDGDADVLSALSNDDKIVWYENLGRGHFGPQQLITISANGASSVYAADLDGDGDADVISASLFDDKIAWYENRFNSSVQYSIQTTVIPTQGGRIQCLPNPVEHGASGTCTATPTSGYTLTHWSGDCSGTAITCTLSNITSAKAITAHFATQDLTATQSAERYVPGMLLTVTGQFNDRSGAVAQSLGWVPELPSGWEVVSAVGDGQPQVNNNSILFTGNLQLPIDFRYHISVPITASGAASLRAQVRYQSDAMINPITLTAAPDPLVLDQHPIDRHSADYGDPGWQIDLDEANRVLAYWRAQAYHSNPAGLDGYAPGERQWTTGQARTRTPDGTEPSLQTSQGASPDAYTAGRPLTITNAVGQTGDAPILSLIWTPTLPSGWAITEVSGEGAPELSPEGDAILFSANELSLPLRFSYQVQVPITASGPQAITAALQYHRAGMRNPTPANVQALSLTDASNRDIGECSTNETFLAVTIIGSVHQAFSSEVGIRIIDTGMLSSGAALTLRAPRILFSPDAFHVARGGRLHATAAAVTCSPTARETIDAPTTAAPRRQVKAASRD